jgi:hypothetical protein
VAPFVSASSATRTATLLVGGKPFEVKETSW